MSAIGPKQTSAPALHMSAFGGKADPAVFAYRDVDGEAFAEADPAQGAHKADHAPIATEQRLFIISFITASFVSGSKNGLSMSRNASRHHSCGDIPLASFIGFCGGAPYRVSQPVKANPRMNRISTCIIRRGYGEVVNQTLGRVHFVADVRFWPKADMS